MIIWGSKGRRKEVAQGSFFCPKCAEIRPYKQKRVSKYFTLYFIPLFETKNLGEYVECQVCMSGFDPKILEPGAQSTLKLVAATRYSLLHGRTPAEVQAQLMERGLDQASANRIITLAQS